MDFESSQSFQRVEAENVAEHEKLLFDQIAKIGLIYLRRAEHEDDELLSERVDRLTPILRVALRSIWKSRLTRSEVAEAVDAFEDKFCERLDQLDPDTYRDEDIVAIMEEIQGEVDTYVQEHVEGSASEGNEKTRGDGLLQWEPPTFIEKDSTSRLEPLRRHGFSAADSVVEVHMRPAFLEGKDSAFSMSDLKKSFGHLAEDVVDHAPMTKAIVGVSWLIDTPIGKRLGFTDVPEAEMPLNDFSTWYQFIDEHGQIHEARFRQFLETGELPYRNMLGYIPIEDFLRRYLSEERKRRGHITLQEVNEDVYKQSERVRRESKQMVDEWDREIAAHGRVDADRFMEEYPVFQDMIRMYDEEDRTAYIDFIREMGRTGVSSHDFASHMSEEFLDTVKRNREKEQRRMYREKEIDLSGA